MAAIEAANLRRTSKTHTGTVRRRAKEIVAVRGISLAVEPGELCWFETPSRRHASLERS
jgi:hypothetical protein